MSNSNNVTIAKPNVVGAFYSAPQGTPLPTDATTPLNQVSENYANLGYISEDGIKDPSASGDPTLIVAFGGDTVETIGGEFEKSYELELIETLNESVNKEVYGAENTVETTEGYLVIEKNVELPAKIYVIELLLKNGQKRRIVCPSAKIRRSGDIEYTNDDVIKYPATISLIADSTGAYTYQYTSTNSDVSSGESLDN
jgi:hypothetical protein